MSATILVDSGGVGIGKTGPITVLGQDCDIVVAGLADDRRVVVTGLSGLGKIEATASGHATATTQTAARRPLYQTHCLLIAALENLASVIGTATAIGKQINICRESVTVKLHDASHIVLAILSDHGIARGDAGLDDAVNVITSPLRNRCHRIGAVGLNDGGDAEPAILFNAQTIVTDNVVIELRRVDLVVMTVLPDADRVESHGRRCHDGRPDTPKSHRFVNGFNLHRYYSCK